MAARHNAEFDEAQHRFFEHDDKGALTQIYRITYDLAKRYIINYGKNKKVYVHAVEEKAHDVATTIIERKFIKQKGARIKKLTSYIYYDCVHEIVKDARIEQEVEAWQNEGTFASGAGADNY